MPVAVIGICPIKSRYAAHRILSDRIKSLATPRRKYAEITGATRITESAIRRNPLDSFGLSFIGQANATRPEARAWSVSLLIKAAQELGPSSGGTDALPAGQDFIGTAITTPAVAKRCRNRAAIRRRNPALCSLAAPCSPSAAFRGTRCQGKGGALTTVKNRPVVAPDRRYVLADVSSRGSDDTEGVSRATSAALDARAARR